MLRAATHLKVDYELVTSLAGGVEPTCSRSRSLSLALSLSLSIARSVQRTAAAAFATKLKSSFRTSFDACLGIARAKA